MGRLILLLVVMALSSHLERPWAEKTEEVVSMTSPQFFGQSYEHSSPSNLPGLPLPYSPFGFNHQTYIYHHLLNHLQALSDFLFMFIQTSEPKHLVYEYPFQ